MDLEKEKQNLKIEPHVRGKTAMSRYDFSRPVKFALRDLIITKEITVFDYGCGRGSDVDFLVGKGIQTSGWDPHFYRDNEKIRADIVNLGYVINVIEDPDERIRVLEEAFKYTNKCLIISAQHTAVAISGKKHSDGILTNRETFQKYYTQSELSEFILTSLGISPYPVSRGIFYVFKDEAYRLEYLANKYDSTRFLVDSNLPFSEVGLERPRSSKRIEKFAALADNINAEQLVDWVSLRGRMPREIEFEGLSELIGKGISKSVIEKWVMKNVNQEKFQRAQEIKKRNVILFLAVTRLDRSGRPRLREMPGSIAQDLKSFFKTYSIAAGISDILLLSVGQPEVIKKAITASEVGKKLPDSLYVHSSAVPFLPEELQVLIACGKTLVGELDGDIIIKIPKRADRISFLLYKDFDKEDHPELLLSVQANFNKQKTFIRDYSQSDNPPILHRKETFVHPTYPLYTSFKELTDKEEILGLLSRSDIGFKKGWKKVINYSNKE